MKHTLKKLLCLALAALLTAGMLPLAASASYSRGEHYQITVDGHTFWSDEDYSPEGDETWAYWKGSNGYNALNLFNYHGGPIITEGYLFVQPMDNTTNVITGGAGQAGIAANELHMWALAGSTTTITGGTGAPGVSADIFSDIRYKAGASITILGGANAPGVKTTTRTRIGSGDWTADGVGSMWIAGGAGAYGIETGDFKTEVPKVTVASGEGGPGAANIALRKSDGITAVEEKTGGVVMRVTFTTEGAALTLDVDKDGKVSSEAPYGKLYLAAYQENGQFDGLLDPAAASINANTVLKAFALSPRLTPLAASREVLVITEPGTVVTDGAYDAVIVTAAAGTGSVTLDGVTVRETLKLWGGSELILTSCTVPEVEVDVPLVAITADDATGDFSITTRLETKPAVTVNGASASVECSHAWSDWKSDGAQTHSRTCANCHEKETEGHMFTTQVMQPSTGNPGRIVNTCSVCGYSETANLALDVPCLMVSVYNGRYQISLDYYSDHDLPAANGTMSSLWDSIQVRIGDQTYDFSGQYAYFSRLSGGIGKFMLYGVLGDFTKKVAPGDSGSGLSLTVKPKSGAEFTLTNPDFRFTAVADDAPPFLEDCVFRVDETNNRVYVENLPEQADYTYAIHFETQYNDIENSGLLSSDNVDGGLYASFTPAYSNNPHGAMISLGSVKYSGGGNTLKVLVREAGTPLAGGRYIYDDYAPPAGTTAMTLVRDQSYGQLASFVFSVDPADSYTQVYCNCYSNREWFLTSRGGFSPTITTEGGKTVGSIGQWSFICYTLLESIGLGYDPKNDGPLNVSTCFVTEDGNTHSASHPLRIIAVEATTPYPLSYDENMRWYTHSYDNTKTYEFLHDGNFHAYQSATTGGYENETICTVDTQHFADLSNLRAYVWDYQVTTAADGIQEIHVTYYTQFTGINA